MTKESMKFKIDIEIQSSAHYIKEDILHPFIRSIWEEQIHIIMSYILEFRITRYIELLD